MALYTCIVVRVLPCDAAAVRAYIHPPPLLPSSFPFPFPSTSTRSTPTFATFRTSPNFAPFLLPQILLRSSTP